VPGQFWFVFEKILVVEGALVSSVLENHKPPATENIGKVSVLGCPEKAVHDCFLELFGFVDLKGLPVRQPAHDIGLALVSNDD